MRSSRCLFFVGVIWIILFALQLKSQAPATAEPPGAQPPTPPLQFEFLTAHVGIYRDVVNVGVIRKNGKALLIDSGDGDILQALIKMGVGSVDWVLYTHHHRDQCSNAGRLKEAGVKIGVPATEAKLFRTATEFWLDAERILDHRYNFRPHLFTLRNSVVPDHEFQADEVFQWEGVNIRVIPTPGHTQGSVSYVIELDGQKVAFTGDVIYGPGQVWELYSLQKRFPRMPLDYWGFGGATSDVMKSLERVLAHEPALLVPSHGVVMRDPRQAVALLRKNLEAAMGNYLTLTSWRPYYKFVRGEDYQFDPDAVPSPAPSSFPPLPPAQLPAWLHKVGGTSWYVQAEDRSIFLFDAGVPPLLDELEQMMKAGTISGIDGIWISHYHDDHVALLNWIRLSSRTKVYAQKELQDILENPRAYPMPALHPEGTRVDHPLQEGEVVRWKGYEMTAFYFPGQTLYHGALLIDREGTRVFLVGDSFSNWGIDDYTSHNRNFLGRDKGYQQCIQLLMKLKPDLLLGAHWGALPVSQEYLEKTLNLLQEREALFARLLPWDNPNFGLDPYWVRAYPYRQSVLPGQLVTLDARIYNHSDSEQKASVELRAPAGWQVNKPGFAVIPPHSEGRIRLTAVAPTNPARRREVLGLAVRFGRSNLGEVAEAIVDYMQ